MSAKVLSPNHMGPGDCHLNFLNHTPWENSSVWKKSPFRSNFWSRTKFSFFSDSNATNSSSSSSNSCSPETRFRDSTRGQGNWFSQPSPPPTKQHFATKYFTLLKDKIAQRYVMAFGCQQHQTHVESKMSMAQGGITIDSRYQIGREEFMATSRNVTAQCKRESSVYKSHRTTIAYRANSGNPPQTNLNCDNVHRETPRLIHPPHPVPPNRSASPDSTIRRRPSRNVIMRITRGDYNDEARNDSHSSGLPSYHKSIPSDADSFYVVPLSHSPVLQERSARANSTRSYGAWSNAKARSNKRKFGHENRYLHEASPYYSPLNKTTRLNGMTPFGWEGHYGQRAAVGHPFSTPYPDNRHANEPKKTTYDYGPRSNDNTSRNFRVVPITYDESFYKPRTTIPIVVEPDDTSDVESCASNLRRPHGGVRIQEISSVSNVRVDDDRFLPSSLVLSYDPGRRIIPINPPNGTTDRRHLLLPPLDPHNGTRSPKKWGETSSFSDFNFNNCEATADRRNKFGQVRRRQHHRTTTTTYRHGRTTTNLTVMPIANRADDSSVNGASNNATSVVVGRLVDRYPGLGVCVTNRTPRKSVHDSRSSTCSSHVAPLENLLPLLPTIPGPLSSSLNGSPPSSRSSSASTSTLVSDEGGRSLGGRGRRRGYYPDDTDTSTIFNDHTDPSEDPKRVKERALSCSKSRVSGPKARELSRPAGSPHLMENGELSEAGDKQRSPVFLYVTVRIKPAK